MKTDREKLRKIVETWLAEPVPVLEKFNFGAELTEYLISKGVTIPVHCGECRYYAKTPHSCKCELHSEIPDQYGDGFDMQMLEVDFCSYGERKEE